MKKIIFVLMLIVMWTLLFYGCSNNKGTSTISNKNTVVYKITDTSDEFFQWNGLIKNVESIPLETNNNSLIGQLTKGVINKNDIYLLDFRNQNLLNFDKTGKFIRKIGQRGKGPNEFLEVRDFCISNNNLYILDYKKILCYNRINGDVVDKANIDEILKQTAQDNVNLNKKQDNGSSSNTGRSTGSTKNRVDTGQSPGTSTGNNQNGGTVTEGSITGSETGEDITSGTDETGENEPGRDSGSSYEHNSPGRGTGTERNGESNTIQTIGTDNRKPGLTPEQQDHIIKPEDTIVPNGEVSKIRANIKAIKLAKTLEKNNRNATPAEKKVLAQYVGWGGLAPVFKNEYWDNNWKTKYESFYKELRDLITDEEFRAAKESTINAHYTDRNVIEAMWKMVEKMGFKGGRILEPAGGIGHFFGLMPEQIHNNSTLRGVELDKISGLIFSKLYPQARIDVSGFEQMHDANNSYDLTISNVPFAGIHVHDTLNKDISKEFTLHNYFIAKSIRLLKPGGVAAFITTSSTMDNEGQGAKFRQWVNSPDGGNADLIEAIRLPNNAFKENAGTEVTTDILFFRKRTGETKHPLAKNFLVNGDYGEAMGKDKEDNSNYYNKRIIPGEIIIIRVNEFYLNNPDRMLGEMKLAWEVGAGGLYSPDMPTLHAPKGLNVAKKLNEIAETFPEDIFNPPVIEEKPTSYAEKGQSEGELVTKDGKPYIVSYGELVEPDWNDNKVTGTDGKTKYTKAQIVDRYTEIKKILKSLVIAESKAESTDEEIEILRKELNNKYDKYQKDLGNIYDNRKTNFLADDVDYSLVSSLENVEQVSEKDKDGVETFVVKISKAGIFNKRMNQPREEPNKADNIDDALDISFAYRNGLDLEYMATLTGKDVDEIKQDLLQRELAYENPLTGVIEDKDTYLSGYVRKKLKQAEAAVEKDSKFKTNVEEYREGEKYLVEKVFDEILKRNPNTKISFVLGIPGAGKSRAVRKYIEKDRIVYDSVMSGEGKIDKNILKAGDRAKSIAIVHTDPKEAYSGTINRGLSSGRFVPIPYMLNAVKQYSNLSDLLFEKYGNSIKLRNFVRKGNEYSKVPFNSNIDVNYNVTQNDLLEVYENHPQFKNLNDEQRERIKGTAYTAGLDEGGNRGGRSSLGQSIEGSERGDGKGRVPEVKPDPTYGAGNKIFTEDAAAAARERLRQKRNNLNIGLDFSAMSDVAILAGYHIESGARKFADFVKRMAEDIGEEYKPYFKGAYENIRRWPGMEETAKEMDNTDVVDSWSFKSEKGFNPENLIVYNKDEYYLWNSNPDIWDRSKGEYFRMRKIRRDKIDSEYFKYKYKTSGDPRFYPCGNDSYYLKPVDGEYVIYKLTKDSICTSFEIDFGNRALIPEEINELRNSDIPNAYLKSNFFKSISNILEVKDYIYFNCIGPGSKKYEGLINKKTGKIKFGRWDYKRSPRFFYSDGELLFGYYEPNSLIEKLNNNSELNTCFDLVRKNLPEIQVSDNLILVTVYLK